MAAGERGDVLGGQLNLAGINEYKDLVEVDEDYLSTINPDGSMAHIRVHLLHVNDA